MYLKLFFQETPVDEAESQNPLHLSAPLLTFGPGGQLQGRLSETVASSGDGGVVWGPDPLKMQPLSRVYLRRFLYRGEIVNAQSFHRYWRENHLARHARIRA
jgi:hypothetical protein